MIELLSTDKCVQCNLCVKVCPTNVFEKVEGEAPTIARQSDCQTCFMCELYCPVDALYVTPFAEKIVGYDEDALEEQGILGGYREKVGWIPKVKPVASHENIYLLYKQSRF